jgi:hypothetical protein
MSHDVASLKNAVADAVTRRPASAARRINSERANESGAGGTGDVDGDTPVTKAGGDGEQAKGLHDSRARRLNRATAHAYLLSKFQAVQNARTIAIPG